MGRSHSMILLIVLLVLLQHSSSLLRVQPFDLGLVDQGCPKSEQEALMKFKHSLSDPANRLSSWKGDDCCAWDGVICDNITGHVFGLDLRNGFEYHQAAADYDPRTIETWIGGVRLSLWKGQTVMHVSSGNNISNELTAQNLDPSLAELMQLRYLDLSSNNFQGARIPEFLGSLKHLRYLNLSWASFTGDVPPSFGNLIRLRALDLHGNNGLFLGNLHWLSRLVRLQFLDMGYAHLNMTHTRSSVHVLSKLPSLLDLRLMGFGLGIDNVSNAFFNSTWLSTLQHLDLSQNDFEGPLPHYFANMSSLKSLDLSGNEFRGSIPLWLGNMRALESINLDDNAFSHVEGGTIMGIMGNPCKFKSFYLSKNFHLAVEITGPHDNFSRCSSYNLESLDLNSNGMTGTLLPYGVLRHLTNLKYLDLSGNKFHGPIPISIGNLSSLEVIDLSDNNVNGPIPTSLGGLSSLKILGLSNMFLEGVLSESHLANLSSLVRLDLSFTPVKLNFSSDWVPPFQLSELLMKACEVEGQSLPKWIQTQINLIALDMSHNRLREQVLESLGQYEKLIYLDLSSNLMQGAVSDHNLANLSSLSFLDLSFNALNLNFTSDWRPPFQLSKFHMRSCRAQGQLPLWIQSQYKLQSLDLSDNYISGEMADWSWNNVNLQYLNLSHNRISGSLTHFPPQLSFIDLSNNLLSGEIPDDSWCNYSTPHGGAYIKLSFNNISGHLPISIGLISNLVALHLNNNSFEGEIPPIFSRCNWLQVLDLGENKLSGNVPHFGGESRLQILRLRSNKLDGKIPLQWCSLSQLQILDLAENNLIGSIPHCFGHLYGMKSPPPIITESINSWTIEYPNAENIMVVLNGLKLQYTSSLMYVVNLDLSCNRLMGSVPEELTDLSGLIGLNLSNNHLIGRIPEKIGEMASLETLDLSNNNLSGTIPSSISLLYSLNHLNLSYNHLHGEIPTGHQLQTLTDPSIYASNLGLCGDPLPSKCTREQDEQQQQQQEGQDQELEHEGEDRLETILFYLVAALGFGTGFLAAIGTLLLKKNWRHALFQLVEDFMDYLHVQVAVIIINKMRK